MTEVLGLHNPILQLGAFGLCVLLIWLLWWLIRQLLSAYRANTRAIEQLTAIVNSVATTSQDVRDRLLQWECPWRTS